MYVCIVLVRVLYVVCVCVYLSLLLPFYCHCGTNVTRARTLVGALHVPHPCISVRCLSF